MITEKVGNLLEAKDVDVCLHQANIYACFGAGLALSIKQKFPEAYDADCETKKGSEAKLGTFSSAAVVTPNNSSIKHIVNLYSQKGLGGTDRQTSYDAMVNGLTLLRSKMERRRPMYSLGIPYKLGCGLANGDFRIVRAIIESVFADSPIQVYIYYLPEFAGEMK